MAQVFVSYSRSAATTLGSLTEDLDALGHTVWADRELAGGQAWWTQILAAIRGCDLFIFVLSPDSLESIACKRELAYAEALAKPILPVLAIEGVSLGLLPTALSSVQYVDYRQRDRAAALSLARALGKARPAPPLPEPLPTPPDIPTSYLGSLTARIEVDRLLTYEEQTAILVDLRRALRDPATRADALQLVRRLRSRQDLFATVAAEIDEAQSGIGGPAVVPVASGPTVGAVTGPTVTRSVRTPQGVSASPGKGDSSPELPQASTGKAGSRIAASIGLILGTLVGCASMLAGRPQGGPELLWGLSTGAAGAFSCRALLRERPLAIALVALVTAIAWILTYATAYPRDRIAIATVISAPIAAVISTLLVTWVRRIQRKRRQSAPDA